MPVKGDNLINKLILLFVFDKMEVPLSEDTISEMCCTANDWIAFMDCKPTLSQLLDNTFIYQIDNAGTLLYAITPNGRVCLADFFVKIPTSTRENISLFVRANRTKYRKQQEYIADYYMNKDGTYTVFLKIQEPAGAQLELKIVVPTRQTAKSIFNKWKDKAEVVYSTVYENLID